MACTEELFQKQNPMKHRDWEAPLQLGLLRRRQQPSKEPAPGGVELLRLLGLRFCFPATASPLPRHHRPRQEQHQPRRALPGSRGAAAPPGAAEQAPRPAPAPEARQNGGGGRAAVAERCPRRRLGLLVRRQAGKALPAPGELVVVLRQPSHPLCQGSSCGVRATRSRGEPSCSAGAVSRGWWWLGEDPKGSGRPRFSSVLRGAPLCPVFLQAGRQGLEVSVAPFGPVGRVAGCNLSEVWMLLSK